ncbi:branched-chain amino acid ABC transporter permease [Xanthobacter sp. VNH20]|jgi:branched-chain amino acid transport system permease protein|uniref:branched-chain amino acid ABC transporter permease n=1 Tax=Xanthobacter sp. VNH20 TaxID=3156616 RepID=UPI0032B5B29D
MTRQTQIMAAAGIFLAIGLVASTFSDLPQINNWLFRISTLVMLATSWNLMANAGLVSLGHSAFWGVGSYTAILSANAFSAGPVTTMLVTIAAGAGLGAMLALVTGNLKGIFFAIATLALSEGLRITALMVPEATGGAVGLFLRHDLQPSQHALYLLGALAAIGSVIVAVLISRSKLQFASRAIRDNEAAAQMLGIAPRRQRLIVVAISGAMASAAGGINAWYGGYLDPEVAFTLHNTILAQIAPILGGIHTIGGPVIGSIAIIFLSEGTRIWFGSMEGISQLTFGLVLIVCILFLPKGIEGLTQRCMLAAGKPKAPPVVPVSSLPGAK